MNRLWHEKTMVQFLDVSYLKRPIHKLSTSDCRCFPRRNYDTKQPSAVGVTEIEAKKNEYLSFSNQKPFERKESAPKSRQPSICFQIRLSLLNIATRGWSILIQWSMLTFKPPRRMFLPRWSWCMIGYSLMVSKHSRKDGNNKKKGNTQHLRYSLKICLKPVAVQQVQRDYENKLYKLASSVLRCHRSQKSIPKFQQGKNGRKLKNLDL